MAILMGPCLLKVNTVTHLSSKVSQYNRGKFLIINADDLGVTLGVNRAISQAYGAGTVSSASLMANMPAFDDAVQMAKSNPSLGVGVHLTLASGKPVLSKHAVPSLVDGDGRFLSRGKLMIGLATRKIALQEVERELRAQVDLVMKSGLQPDHLDGDKHVHILPRIRHIVVSLAGELGLPLRIPGEKIILDKGLSSLLSPKSVLAAAALLSRNSMALDTRQICLERGIKSNGNFLSIFGFVPRQTPETRHLIALLGRVTNGVNEMMVHPGYHDEQLEEFYGEKYLSAEREMELQCLIDPAFKDAVHKNGITLGTYKSLKNNLG
ncbi:MAG: ChbG/HpnK family deacetylase [Proteobacteria bacterium]|nr:ChbG/HpnK family deacetylase [Pseudomonadota bacterium]